MDGATDTRFVEEDVESMKDVVDSCVAAPTVPPSLDDTTVIPVNRDVLTAA